MTAESYRAGLGVTSEATEFSQPDSSSGVADTSLPPAREALRALLAFSSLHQQIRWRRDQQQGTDASDGWEIEDFVLDEVLQLVADRAKQITGADGIAIALAQGDAIVCRGSSGSMAPDPGARLDPGSGFSGACLRGAQIIRCDDTEHDLRVNVAATRSLGARSIVAVPIAGTHGVIGLIEAFSTEPFSFNDSDVRSLKLLAELILAALRPEDEDRLAEISRRVINQKTSETPAHPVHDSNAMQSLIAASIVRDRQAQHVLKRPGMRLVLLCTAVALVLGAALWWRMRSQHNPSPPSRVMASNPVPVAPPASDVAPSSIQDPAPPAADSTQEITGIHTNSSSDSSAVFIDLVGQVQYEAHRLSNPERIYLDFPDTALASGLFGKVIETSDPRLVRVRAAQPSPGVSRVVLETRHVAEFTIRMESNPPRLVIKVRETPAPPSGAALDDAATPASVPASAQLESRASATPRLRIVLDAGHGGWDMGTVGRKGLLEKDLVLDVVSRLGKIVQKRLNADITFTRNSDKYVSLEKRAEIANLAQADLFISVHANYSSDASARGVETYYSNTYSSVRARTADADGQPELQNLNWTNVDIRTKVFESRRFASAIQQALYGTIAASTPGTRNRGVKQAAYAVLTGTTMPAILAEISFVSSPEDEVRLQDPAYRQEIAEALFRGIQRHKASSHKPTIASAFSQPAGN